MKKLLCLILSLVVTMSVVVINDDVVSAKRVKKSGYYSTAVQSNKTGYGGAYIKRVKVKGNRVTTYGSFSFGKKTYGGKKIKKKKRTFVLSGNCKYYDGWGVPGGKRRVTKKEALKHFTST